MSLSLLERDLGPRYTACRLGNFEFRGSAEDQASQKQAVETLKWYYDTLPERVAKGDGLILIGASGTGKDHLLSALARAAVTKHNQSVRWADGARLFSQLRDGMSLDTTENSVLAPLERADILYLSDPVPPGSVLTTFQKSAMFRLIDTRYRHLRPTWLTCNFEDQADAVKSLSASIVDRLRHGSMFIECDWPTYRVARSMEGKVAS